MKIIIPFLQGDGVGPEIWRASKVLFDAAIEKAYGGEREIQWLEIFAGKKAKKKFGRYLPKETLEAFEKHRILLKGPLETPVATGVRSLNVELRRHFDLYCGIRPVRYLTGLPSPLKHPERVNMVVFRESTEDVYMGYEVKAGTKAQKVLRDFCDQQFGWNIRKNSGIGVKPMSEFGSKRLIRRAIQAAIDCKQKSVTIVHKGNIMKYTEGAFLGWGIEVARQEFRSKTILEEEALKNPAKAKGKIVIKSRMTDNFLQQILTRPEEYSMIATANLNGDYISDALAALIGGIGITPSANIGEKHALFEPTHGTAPKYASKNIANPTAFLLAGAMLFEHIGWQEVTHILVKAIALAFRKQRFTQDLARQAAVRPLSTTAFTHVLLRHIR